jgi:cell division topological specificity factor
VFVALKEKFFGDGRRSKSLAKSRLHFVLVQDRTGMTNDEMSCFKKELVSVIEKYFVIDEKGFDITYKRDTDLTTLLINSPVVVKRKRCEISAEPESNKRQVEAK